MKKCNNNTAIKNVRNFRKIIKICLDDDWSDKDHLFAYIDVKGLKKDHIGTRHHLGF